VIVTIRYEVIASSPAQPGIWTLTTDRELPAPPHAGDWIELAPGWASVKVKDVTFMADGRLLADLLVARTDNPSIIAEHHRLADEHGWEWIGKPPEHPEEAP
jgi:hypothetical protein